MKLHSYFYSSASFRVRIALNLKNIPYEYVAVNLRSGAQKESAYLASNTEGLVPALELDDGTILTQSMAIIEYLDTSHPEPALLPKQPLALARARALAQIIACETHPLNNLRVLQYLVKEMNQSEEAKNAWYHHWCRLGLETFERQLQTHAPSKFCITDTPSIVDCMLVPQIFNAQRLKVSLDGLTRTLSAFEACMLLPAFEQAQPKLCPDFVA